MRQLVYIWKSFQLKIWNKRFFLFAVLIFVIGWRVTVPLRHISEAYQYPVSGYLFPFLMCSFTFLAFFWFGVIYVGADAPYMQYVNMFQVIRTGRVKWAVGQIAGIILRSFLMTFWTAACAMLPVMGRLDLSPGWGKLLYTVAMTPGIEQQYGLEYDIFYDALTRFSPAELMGLCILVTSLAVAFVGMMMFVISLYAGRTTAVTCATGYTLALFIVLNVIPQSRQRLAFFVPAIWPEVARIGTKSIGFYILPDIPYMLIVLTAGISGMSILALYKIRTVEFSWENEDL